MRGRPGGSNRRYWRLPCFRMIRLCACSRFHTDGQIARGLGQRFADCNRSEDLALAAG
jgi:hypothetical protein